MSQSVHYPRAILFALTGFTFWVVSDTFLKLIGELAVPKYQIMAVSGIGGMAVIFGVTSLRGELRKLRPHKWSGLLTLGVLHLINFSCWIMAISRLPLTTSYAISFLSPIVVAILAALFLRERFGWKHGLAIIAGFAGVTIAVNPRMLMHNSNEWASYGFVFASMLTISVQMLTLRILGQRESRECAAFYPRVVIFLGTLAACFMFGFRPMPADVALYAFVSGGFGSLGWLFMAHAYKLAPAATVAPFHYSEIVTGTLFGYIVWHDVPSAHVAIGATIIIASGVYIITHTRKSAQLLREESHA